MTSSKTIISLLAALTVSAPALSQDAGVTLDDLDAEWSSDTQIKIEFDYQGGACEETGEAEAGDVVDGVLSVSVPTLATSDVCTMQVVENEVEVAVAADRSVTAVEVLLLKPDGSVAGTGKASVEQD